MKLGSIYQLDTGRIVMSVVAPDEEGVMLQISDREDCAVLFDHELNGREFYIVNGRPAERPAMNLELSAATQIGLDNMAQVKLLVDERLEVSSLPPGTMVIHPQGETVVDDGYIDWSAAEPGKYYFRFENFPFKEVEFYAIVG